jgi:hypothetical protein
MLVEKRKHILVFEDAVGITKGYRPIFDRLIRGAGLTDSTVRISIRSTYRRFDKRMLLHWQPPRKTPGFNPKPAVQNQVRAFINECIAQHEADFVLCMDPAILFLYNPDWTQAKLDTLRGGVYLYETPTGKVVPTLVTLPMTAFHSKVSSKDIAKLNEGFIEKADFEEWRDSEESEEEESSEDETMEWHEPITIAMGHIQLMFDFAKMGRIIGRMGND